MAQNKTNLTLVTDSTHFQKTEIHCEKLKTRYNFYASFKVTLQGVEMEDALSSHI